MEHRSAHVGRLFSKSTPLFDKQPQPNVGAPNVVMIVLDDLGFAQLGCFGSDIETPNIDRLAELGLRYNNFHVTALCSPSRACLLTGRNHHAVGMGFLPTPMGFPGYSGRIPKSARMLPRLLRDAGYSTFAVGKWHLMPRFESGPAGPFERWPLGMGFERYYGFLGAETNQWTPELIRDNGLIDPPLSPDDGYHLTEDLAAQAIRFVQDQQQASPDKPFFLYFATGAMHSPHHVPGEWVEPYHGRFDEGWEVWRQRVFQRQLRLGILPPETKLTERPSWVPDWDGLTSDERRVFARMMEVYAAFLAHTDAHIGRLLDFLATLGALDNTIVMILSDNGASADGGPHGALTSQDNAQINDMAPMLNRINDLGSARAYNHYPWGWAWAGNSPFRLWKHYAWLGGVRTPLIIKPPVNISAHHKGHVRSQFCHAIDLMPTILDVTGVGAPDVIDGVPQQPIDGESLLPTFTDAHQLSPRNTQYFEVMSSRAIYHDGWMATTDHVADLPAQRMRVEGSHEIDTDRWSLFDLTSDFSEANDVAEAHPDRLRQMVELWWYEAGRNQVLPLIEGALERVESTEPRPYPGRCRYVYRPGGGPILLPPIRHGFQLVADVEIAKNGDPAGIVCAQGDLNSGWACYFLGGRLVVTFSFAGSADRVVAQDPVQPGKHKVVITCVPGSESPGSLTVGLDDRRIDTTPITWKPPWVSGVLRIGLDQGTPVCEDYRAPFPFTGHVHSLVFEVPKAGFIDLYDEVDVALKHD